MSVITRSALEASPLADLHTIGSELGIDGYRRLRKADLIEKIIEIQGVAPEPEGAEADVKESMVRAARRRIVLADSSKVGEVHLHRFARLDDLDLVITDEDLDEDHLAELRTDDGPEVVLA